MQGPDFHIESPEPCFLTLAFFIAFFIIFVHNINFSKDLPARYYQKKKKKEFLKRITKKKIKKKKKKKGFRKCLGKGIKSFLKKKINRQQKYYR